MTGEPDGLCPRGHKESNTTEWLNNSKTFYLSLTCGFLFFFLTKATFVSSLKNNPLIVLKTVCSSCFDWGKGKKEKLHYFL